MREIKFRAWDKENKVMINAIFVGLGKVYGMTKTFKPSKELEDVILMQYTGLKDKNGKEIYEGDVVKGEWDVVEEIYVSDVQFYGGAFRVHKTGLPLEYGYMRRECEVIGNIYENPELLDKD